MPFSTIIYGIKLCQIPFFTILYGIKICQIPFSTTLYGIKICQLPFSTILNGIRTCKIPFSAILYGIRIFSAEKCLWTQKLNFLCNYWSDLDELWICSSLYKSLILVQFRVVSGGFDLEGAASAQFRCWFWLFCHQRRIVKAVFHTSTTPGWVFCNSLGPLH